MSAGFRGKYIIKANMVCETGLHIGGNVEGFEIGGLDNPVVKNPATGEPYVPGSSLKGRMRYLLEWATGRISSDEKGHYGPCRCGTCTVCRLFGVSAGSSGESSQQKTEEHESRLPTRLTVRDAYLLRTVENGEKLGKVELEAILGEGIYTEIKTENTIDRVTSEANPRPMERIPAGSVFEVEMVFDVFDGNGDQELFPEIFNSLGLLEDSTLGGSGSRGYGKVLFEDVRVVFRPVEYYLGTRDEISVLKARGVREALEKLSSSAWWLPAEQVAVEA